MLKLVAKTRTTTTQASRNVMLTNTPTTPNTLTPWQPHSMNRNHKIYKRVNTQVANGNLLIIPRDDFTMVAEISNQHLQLQKPQTHTFVTRKA